MHDASAGIIENTASAIAANYAIEAGPQVRRLAPRMKRGIVAERWHSEWASLPRQRKWIMGNLLHGLQTRLDFIAYHVKDLPALAPLTAHAFGLPVLTWTVRSAEDRALA